MKTCTVELKEEYPFLQGGTLECLVGECPWDVIQEWKRPAVIVVAGGGYAGVSKREGEPVAFEFLARGFQVFILRYLVGGENGVPYPEQLFELASAVDYIKKNAKTFAVNPDEVFAVGFSAGGHLTANLAVEYETVSKRVGVSLDCKPTAIGLGYPVISQKHGHQRSFDNLLFGYTDEAKTELLKTLNLDEVVSETTPPAFIWTTAKDTCVPPDNALRYAAALDRQGIDYELHVYPRLNHGKSTGNLEINAYTEEDKAEHRRISRWMGDCVSFFRLYIKEAF